MNIIIATYGDILLYNLEDDKVESLDQDGDYYETLVNQDKILTICRPQFKKYSDNYLKILANNEEQLIKIDGNDINSLIKSEDNKYFYYTSSENGMLYKYNINSFEIEQSVKLSYDRKVISSIALKNNIIYVASEYESVSDVYIYDMTNNYNKIKSYKKIGYNLKDIVFWDTGFLFLNSDDAELWFFNETTKESFILFSFEFIKNSKIFLSGLFVINNFAFIGVNFIASKFNHSSSLACIDLLTNRIRWLKKIDINSYINSITFTNGYKYLTNKVKNMIIKFPGIYLDQKIDTIRKIGYYPTNDLKKIFYHELKEHKIIEFISTNESYSQFYQTTYFKKYQKYIRAIIRYIFGTKKIGNIVRCYLTMYQQGFKTSKLNNKNNNKFKRFYLALKSNEKILFNFFNKKWFSFNIDEGEIVELNNQIDYSIANKGTNEGIYLIIDYSDVIVNNNIL